MKNLVIKPFIDKNTKKGFSVGNVYESDDLDRIAFLVEKGFLKAQEIQIKQETEKPKPKRTRKKKAGE